jgi:hypothetical protein
VKQLKLDLSMRQKDMTATEMFKAIKADRIPITAFHKWLREQKYKARMAGNNEGFDNGKYFASNAVKQFVPSNY